MDIIYSLQLSLNSIINNELLILELFSELKVSHDTVLVMNKIKELHDINLQLYNIEYYKVLLNTINKDELTNIFSNIIKELQIKKTTYEFIKKYNKYFNVNIIKKYDILISKYLELANILLIDIVTIEYYKDMPIKEATEASFMPRNIIHKLYNAWLMKTYQLSLNDNYEKYIDVISDNLGRMNYLKKLL